ncbi:hypothetical protein Acr_16g0001060 [Actinidia rufa]|uniref:Uncharacterized protein n=1 Tax=Actinidia rufa TaxID=165716 RepID=A0A7J0FXQ8_9ERIC|nr:hypothetical protein Acr_16g0001060 [Actinidia rufa]
MKKYVTKVRRGHSKGCRRPRSNRKACRRSSEATTRAVEGQRATARPDGGQASTRADSALEPRRSSRNVEVRELHEEDFLSAEKEGDKGYDFESNGERALEGYGEEELET